ncbi:ABC transporter transmembrane domain-containing protein [Corynebacterium phocae]|uniref:ABC transporter transmembrane domain-containing protein n=1 Tax=Corynebacterium phocae TaxID=161895 RepID=UPI001FE959B8|nr:ABC transporter transmembrane domain-containing protein [Corynebacterium phocae]
MKLLQRNKDKPPVPYVLGAGARKSIALGVVLYLVAVVGMCLSIYGAGRIVDAYPQRPGLGPVLVGPVVVAVALWLRGWLLARGEVREESLVRHRLLGAVFKAGPARSARTSTGAVVALSTEAAEKMMAFRARFVSQLVASLTAPLLVIAAVALCVSGDFALVLLVMLPMVPLLVGGFRKVASRVSSDTQDARKDLAAGYMESLQSLVTLRLLGVAEGKADELEAAGERNRLDIMRLL